MIAKQLAETALLLWNRMGERPFSEKAAILKTLANWLEAEQIEQQQASRQALNAQMAAPPIADEHYRA